MKENIEMRKFKAFILDRAQYLLSDNQSGDTMTKEERLVRLEEIEEFVKKFYPAEFAENFSQSITEFELLKDEVA